MNTNKVMAMFNMEVVKHRINHCAKDALVILCTHWSINQPKYPDDADPESLQWDMDEMEKELGLMLFVTDYDDLCVDPHGLNSN